MGKGKEVGEGEGRPDLQGGGTGYARDRQTEKYREVEEGKGNWTGQTEGNRETRDKWLVTWNSDQVGPLLPPSGPLAPPPNPSNSHPQSRDPDRKV